MKIIEQEAFFNRLENMLNQFAVDFKELGYFRLTRKTNNEEVYFSCLDEALTDLIHEHLARVAFDLREIYGEENKEEEYLS